VSNDGYSLLKSKGIYIAYHSLFLIISTYTLLIPATCNATRIVHHHSQLDQQQVFGNYTWYVQCNKTGPGSEAGNRAYLPMGFCATFDTDSMDILSLGECPSYHGFTFLELGDGSHWYTVIQLPDNVSEFNDYMCGPLNRRGSS
jgi:hypothetical protein